MSTSPATAPSPGSSLPGAPSAAPTDVGQQIAQLTDAVNRLVQAQAQQHQQQSVPVHVAPRAAAPDIGGDIPGGAALLPAVDVAKLSPLQQITLGLRDAKPVGPAYPEVLRAERAHGAAHGNDDAHPAGAD
jgi:hypothetical protein